MSERSVNKAILVGRLGSDADTVYTQSGKPVSRLSLAMNREFSAGLRSPVKVRCGSVLGLCFG